MKIPIRGKAPKTKKIAIPKDELVSEHQQLIKTLKTQNKVRMKREIAKQSKELKGYKHA